MKRLLPFLILSLAVWLSCSKSGNASTNASSSASASVVELDATADTSQVPRLVLNKFISLFPKVTKVEWKAVDNDYVAVFQYEQGEKYVRFSSDGEMIIAETEIHSNSLPEAMITYISQHLSGKKIDRAKMVNTRSGGITFQLEVGTQEYIFDGSGNFLRVEEKEKE